ncbi:MAG: SPOR domain-containing protein [Deltaproteobacteria bacterium]|nr:SPOR domain-containing protein [Deltaproteobacteria bacterium]
MAGSGKTKRRVTQLGLLIVLVPGALWLAGNVMQGPGGSRKEAWAQAVPPQPVVVKKKLSAPAGSTANLAEGAEPAMVRKKLPPPPASELPPAAAPAPEPPQAAEAPPPAQEEKPAETVPAAAAVSSPPSPPVTRAAPVATPPPAKPEPAKPPERAGTERFAAPFSILLSSCRDRENALAALPHYQKAGLTPYVVQTDLGDKGTWWRTLTGSFKSLDEASRAKKAFNLADAVVVKTPFANLVGAYPSEAGATEMAARLGQLGHFPYTVKGPKDSVQLVVGAFLTKPAAEKLQRELAAQGIASQVVQR